MNGAQRLGSLLLKVALIMHEETAPDNPENRLIAMCSHIILHSLELHTWLHGDFPLLINLNEPIIISILRSATSATGLSESPLARHVRRSRLTSLVCVVQRLGSKQVLLPSADRLEGRCGDAGRMVMEALMKQIESQINNDKHTLNHT